MADGVVDNPAESRYELAVEGVVAIAAYQHSGDVLMFTHTAVPDALEGRGIGSRLVKGALEDVRAKGLTIVPACSFVAAYVEQHPEVTDLVAKRD